MNKSLLTEVNYIDGNIEFYINTYKTELITKNSSIHNLQETPLELSSKFTGDISLFETEVFKEEDLEVVNNSYYIDPVLKIIKINPNIKTSNVTSTYVSYYTKSLNKTANLYSVDYEKGIIYFSNKIKNINVEYTNSISYYEGLEMKQQNSNDYSLDKPLTTNLNEELFHIYEITNKNNEVTNSQYLNNLKLNIITLES